MVWEEWEGYGGSRLGDLALLASLKHILVVLSFTVVHIRDVYAIEALASKLVDSPKVLQVLSNRFQELILRMTTSVWGVETRIGLHTLASFIRISHTTILSKRFFFSLC